MSEEAPPQPAAGPTRVLPGAAHSPGRRILAGGGLGAVAGAIASAGRLDLARAGSLDRGGQDHRLASEIADAFAPGIGLGLALGLVIGLALARWRLASLLGVPLRFVERALIAAGVLTLLGLAAFGLRAIERPVAGGPNVLLVVLDTTRRDRISSYGYERPTTPRIDALAAEGTLFMNAYSVSSWTCPSHASLFTGLYPCAHGVTQESWSLSPDLLTLAEILWEEGYRTAGMVGNPMVGSHLGFAQGFDAYHETWREKGEFPAAEHPAVRHLEGVLEEEDERPFFAFINLIEVHSPYRSGPYRGDFDRHPGVELANNHWRAYFTGKVDFSPEELEHLSDLYDGELKYADEIVGAAVDALAEHGHLDDTVVVVTSDHGEHFGNHGLVDHVFNLYEGNVAIPLVVRYPSAFDAGARIERAVQLQDVFPTLLALTGVERFSPETHGERLDEAGAPGTERALLFSYGYPHQALGAIGQDQESPRLEPFRRRLWAELAGGVKTIVSDDGSVEIFDVIGDPSEANDLASAPEHTERAGRALRALLERVERLSAGHATRATFSGEGGAEIEGLDDETRAMMESLGYFESSGE